MRLAAAIRHVELAPFPRHPCVAAPGWCGKRLTLHFGRSGRTSVLPGLAWRDIQNLSGVLTLPNRSAGTALEAAPLCLTTVVQHVEFPPHRYSRPLVPASVGLGKVVACDGGILAGARFLPGLSEWNALKDRRVLAVARLGAAVFFEVTPVLLAIGAGRCQDDKERRPADAAVSEQDGHG